MKRIFDCIILGAGPAGFSASIYCARANVSCCLIDKGMAGGRPLGYLEIENYLGLGKTSTFDMLEKFREHVDLFNIPIFECEEVKEVDLHKKIVVTEQNIFKGKTLIIATGSKPRLLGVPGEIEYVGKGVHYCAICDGPLYKDKTVAVIGGGNSACEEALGLSKICKRVYIFEYTDKLNADKVTLDKIKATENIDVFTGCEVQEIIGDEKVKGIKIRDLFKINFEFYYDVDAVFPYIGFTPNTELFDTKIEKDEQGFLHTDERMRTAVDGVYAAGDARVKALRQVVTAVSDGAVAGVEVGKYLRWLQG